MTNDVVILVAEDDDGHATLIKKNLSRAGLMNEVKHFKDGQQILDFLLQQGQGPRRDPSGSYVLLLDIRMPKVDGLQVLEQVKGNPELRKIPVIMITTTDDPREVDLCHDLGCNSYITKPVDYDSFVATIRQLGFYLAVVKVPSMHAEK